MRRFFHALSHPSAWPAILGLVAILGLLSWPLATSFGQEAEEDNGGNGEAVAAEPAPAPENNGDPPPVEESYLSFFFKALGIKYTVAFLCLSFTLVALLVMNLMAARRDHVAPIQLVEAFEEHLDQKRYQEAYDLASSDESFLGKVLSAGLARLSAGYPQAIEAMQEVGEEETMKLEHRLSYIALIGSISPMVGLLGTVDGMVAAFSNIAQSTQAPSPPVLAGNISTALVTTLVGLWLAIPAIAVHGILRNRLARLVLEVGVVSEQLMSRFEKVGPKRPAKE